MKWKNIPADTAVFFITATITEWQPLFNYERPRRILLDDLAFYRQKYSAGIYAYVIMPEHYHIVLTLGKPEMLHDFLRDIQGHSSNEMSKWLRKEIATLGDSSLSAMHKQFSAHANGQSKLAIWKEQARAVGILTETVLKTKIDYIHRNPVKRGLVENPEDWQWSSWRNYCLGDDSILQVELFDLN